MDTNALSASLFLFAGSATRAANVVGAWLLTYAVHSTVLLLAAWGLVSVRRLRWSPAAQHAIWSSALVAGVVTATVQVASPMPTVGGALQLAEAGRHTVAAVQVTQRANGAPLAQRLAGIAPFDLPAGTALRMPSASQASFRLMVFTITRAMIGVAVWGVVALALLAHLALARRRLHHLLATRADASDSLAAAALRHLAERAGVRRPIALSTSDALPAPAAISSHEIVLPTRALHTLTLAEQEGVLAHELAHVVRRDTGWWRLARWIERLAWFQPLNRVARREMQLSAEFAADAWAVRVTRQPITLAQALARVASWLTADPSPAARTSAAFAPGADGSPLVERVRRLTTPTPPRDGLGGGAARSAMLVAASCALALLPRVDVAPLRKAEFARDERFELRLAGNERNRRHPLPPLPAQPMLKPGIRILRFSDSTIRLLPASASDSIVRLPGRARVIVLAREIS